MRPRLKISVFFPAYNEEANIKNTVTKAIRVLRSLKADYEVIIVDDGSKDKTGELADALARKNKKVKVIHHRPNRGYGGALKSGFYAAKKEVVAFTDSDGQFDFREISKFLKKLRKADFVVGYRIKRAEGFGRWFLAQALRIWDLFLFWIWYKDIDCGFKAIKRKALYQIPKLVSENAMISTELLVKAKRVGLAIEEVPVSHHLNPAEKIRREGGAHPKIILRAVKGTFDLWRALRP